MTEKTGSCLPAGGGNLFQDIKKMTTAAEAAGVTVWRLTIGQPKGAALESARVACSQAALSPAESMHEYQDNGSPGVPFFAERFIQLHQQGAIINGQHLPIPGIKPMLGQIPQACGHVYLPNGKLSKENLVATMTNPGYPTPAVQCQYQGVPHYAINLTSERGFVFSTDDIKPGTTLIMANYPHNPSGQIATRDFWIRLCQYCTEHGIRLFNDAAYAILAYNQDACTLASVAQNFFDLSWCEAYSASKVIGNGTGWRIGAMVGSPDFINDIATIKSNTDSGFVAPAAYGVLACMENDMHSIRENRDTYSARNILLQEILKDNDMRPTVYPAAGFFSLWHVPQEAFGQAVKDGEEFNSLMIQRTGVAGVHFGQYIRYAVTSPIEKPEWREAIHNGFAQAKPVYHQ